MATVRSYDRPATVEAARAAVRRHGAVVLGGGTSVNATPTEEPVAVVDLQALGLDQIEVDHRLLRIGASVTLQALAEHRAVPHAVREAARRELPSTLRATATVGGCVALAEPDSELFAALLVYDALVLTAAGRELPLAVEQLAHGDFVVAVEIATGEDCAWARAGRTRADRAIVSAFVRRHPTGTTRLALTGVASRPVLVDPEALDELEPPGDFRGSTEYRRALAQTLAARAIEEVE
jgi:probable selenate reductase FAD-binding subunit